MDDRIRLYDEQLDLDAVHRIWLEIGWLEGTDKKPALRTLLSAGNTEVGLLDIQQLGTTTAGKTELKKRGTHRTVGDEDTLVLQEVCESVCRAGGHARLLLRDQLGNRKTPLRR